MSGENQVPDPAARPRHWWDTAIIYEIYLRSFQDSDGDGVGDLKGLIQRLDYLAGSPDSLGVDAVWLTPIYPSPLFDFGYDVSDYTAIDPIYGTMDDFVRFTREAHVRNIKVVMDLVLNHTSHLHPWFLESRSSRTNSRRNWYVWHDPAPDGGPPNNWLSVFGGSAWTLDAGSGQYFLHSFLAEQPDLNWRNPAVREALYDVVRFWAGRGVDGFRLDAIVHIAKDEDLRDDPASPGPLPADSTGYEALLPVYSKNDPAIHGWLQELRTAAEEDGTPRMLVSEIYDLSPEDIYLFHGGDRPEMSMSFNFGFLTSPWTADAFRQAVDDFESNLPPGTWPNVVLNNHDRSRFISRHDWDGRGELRARIAAIMLFTLRGAAYLYYGEEIGMRDGAIPRELLHDPVGIQFWPDNPGRDPERTPMQWSADKNGGFTDGMPWLPVSPDVDRVNVEDEQVDRGSLLNLYRRLSRYRRSSPALTYGAYRPLDSTPPDTYCYLRDAAEQRVVIALNFGGEELIVSCSALGPKAEVVASTHQGRPATANLDNLHLRPLEGLVLELPRSTP